MDSIHFWHPQTSNFQGYISTLQKRSNDISSYINIEILKIFESQYDKENAFKYDSIFPSVVNIAENEYPWYKFSFTGNKTFFITHYQLQQLTDSSYKNFLTQWSFEGSNDGISWKILDIQKISKGNSFNQNGSQRIFPTKKGNFKYFRIRCLNENLLVIQKIEIYGYICQNSSLCNLNYIYMHTSEQRIFFKFVYHFDFLLTQ